MHGYQERKRYLEGVKTLGTVIRARGGALMPWEFFFRL
jgi:hypothetical protein